MRRNVRPTFETLVLTAVLLLSLAGFSRPSYALLILDDMIFIGPKAGAATFKIKNTSEQPQAYRMDWTQIRMNPDGSKTTMKPGETIPGVMPAEPYMFVAPRRLILQPDQLQHTRFMVRRTEGLAPGEYRSYIIFQPENVPQEYNPASSGSDTPVKGNASASLDVLSGYRLPVIFLNGDTTLTVRIENAGHGSSAQGKEGVYFTLIREGTRSAIGEVYMKCTGVENEPVLGQAKVKVFTELTQRNFFFHIDPPSPECAGIALDYLPHGQDPDYTGNPVRLAEIPLH